MTAFPALYSPLGMQRILGVNVRQRMRLDQKMEREFRSGRVQHAWEIPWGVLTSTQRTTLDTFFQTCRGRILSDIAYVDPWDGLTYTCRLDLDALDMTAPSPVHWTGKLRLIEIADWKSLKSAVTTFPVTVPFQIPYKMGRQYRTVIEAAEDFTELRFEDLSTTIQRFGVGGDCLTDAQATDLLNCWEGNAGPWREFAFTEVETSTLYSHCHFVETQLTHTLVQPTTGGAMFHSIRATVETLVT